jgi:hypothetical protein
VRQFDRPAGSTRQFGNPTAHGIPVISGPIAIYIHSNGQQAERAIVDERKARSDRNVDDSITRPLDTAPLPKSAQPLFKMQHPPASACGKEGVMQAIFVGTAPVHNSGPRGLDSQRAFDHSCRVCVIRQIYQSCFAVDRCVQSSPLNAADRNCLIAATMTQSKVPIT